MDHLGTSRERLDHPYLPQALTDSATAETSGSGRRNIKSPANQRPQRSDKFPTSPFGGPISPIYGTWTPRALVHVSWGFIPGERRLILMDLGHRNILAPDGPHYSIPPSDFRSPTLSRPPPVNEFMQRSSESGAMEKTPPVTGKRRGGSRKACNECKQQKVSRFHTSGKYAILSYSTPSASRSSTIALMPQILIAAM